MLHYRMGTAITVEFAATRNEKATRKGYISTSDHPVFRVLLTGALAGITKWLKALINANFLKFYFKKYRQKYRYFSKHPIVGPLTRYVPALA